MRFQKLYAMSETETSLATKNRPQIHVAKFHMQRSNRNIKLGSPARSDFPKMVSPSDSPQEPFMRIKSISSPFHPHVFFSFLHLLKKKLRIKIQLFHSCETTHVCVYPYYNSSVYFHIECIWTKCHDHIKTTNRVIDEQKQMRNTSFPSVS